MTEENRANHSLVTEIEMMFRSDGAEKLVNDIFDISDTIADLVKPVGDLTRAFDTLGSSPLKGLVETLKDFDIRSVDVDGSNLNEVLSDKIASAIAKSRIEFIGKGTPERYPFKVKMDKEFWDKNQKNVSKAMADAFLNLEIDTKDILPLDISEVMKEFQAKFNKQIVELMKDDEVFSLFKVMNKGTKDEYKKYARKRKFRLDDEALSGIVGAIEKNVLTMLSDPENIKIAEAPKLNIKSEELNKAIKAIQESIGDVDKLVGVDDKTLKKLPKIENKLMKFRENLEGMINDINDLSEQLQSITFGKASEDDVKKALDTVIKLKQKVNVGISDWIVDLSKGVQKELRIKPDLSIIKDSLSKFNTFFKSFFETQLVEIQTDVENILKKYGSDPQSLAEVAVEKSEVIDITQVIVDAVKEGILKHDIPIKFDSGKLDSIFEEWALGVEATISMELQDVFNIIENGIDDCFTPIIETLDSILEADRKEIKKILNSKGFSEVDEKEIKTVASKIRNEIEIYILKVLQSFSVSGLDASKTVLQLPKSVDRDIKTIINNHIREYSKQLRDNYREGSLDGVDIEGIISGLNKHTAMLTNAVVRRVNQRLTDIRKEFLSSGGGLEDSTVNLKNIFKKNVKSLVMSFIKSLEDSINNIVLTDASIAGLQEQIGGQLLSTISKVSISDASLNNISEGIEFALDDVFMEIRNVLDSYVGSIDKIKLSLEDIYGGKLFDLTEEKLREIIPKIEFDYKYYKEQGIYIRDYVRDFILGEIKKVKDELDMYKKTTQPSDSEYKEYLEVIKDYGCRIEELYKSLDVLDLDESNLKASRKLPDELKQVEGRFMQSIRELAGETGNVIDVLADNIDNIKNKLNKVIMQITDLNESIKIREIGLSKEDIAFSFNNAIDNIVSNVRNILKVYIENINYIADQVGDKGGVYSKELLEKVGMTREQFNYIIDGNYDYFVERGENVFEAIEKGLEESKKQIDKHIAHVKKTGENKKTIDIFEKRLKEIEESYRKLEEVKETNKRGIPRQVVTGFLEIEKEANKAVESFITGIEEMLESIIKFIPEIDSEIRASVKGTLDNYIGKLKEIYTKKKAGGEDLEKEVAKLDKHATMLVNAVLRSVNKSLIDIRKEFIAKDTALADSSNKLKEGINSKLRLLFESICNELEKFVDINIVANDDLIKFRDGLVDQVRDNLSLENIDFTIITSKEIFKRLEPYVKETVVGILDNAKVELGEKDVLSINIETPAKKALRTIQRAINKATNNAIDKIKDEETEEIKLNIKTKRLSDNINSMIQKIINEKSKQITSYGNELVKGIDLDEDSLQKLKNSIDSITDNMIAKYSIAAEKLSSHVYANEEIDKVYKKLNEGFFDTFSLMFGNVTKALKNVMAGDYSVSVSSIHPHIRKFLAESQKMGVREFIKAFPVVRGKEVQKTMIQRNIDIITKLVHDVIQDSIKNIILSYRKSFKKTEQIKPDKSLVGFILDELKKLQDTIVTKARQMVRNQFKYLTEEIKKMNIEARSLGYRPTKAFTREVQKATGIVDKPSSITQNVVGGVDVVSTKVDLTDVVPEPVKPEELVADVSSVIIDGKVVELNVDRFPMDAVRIPIENYTKMMAGHFGSKIPFSTDPEIEKPISDFLKSLSTVDFEASNVFQRGYSPFNINDVRFYRDASDDKGLFEGITSNMAKYFMVGYAMRMPIKAITEANKVASELDFHITKARQNLLMKDPHMTSTAQRIVYDRYTSEGREVRSPEFKKDVEKEAKNLRNAMSGEMSDYLLNISKAYNREISDVGKYYGLVSRKSKDPYEALTKVREISKMDAISDGDLDIDFAAAGLESMAIQWGVHVGDLSRYVNMMLKSSTIFNTTVTDLLSAQRDTAGMFRKKLTGLGDEEAFAASLALSSMFMDVTGKSGRESGTFWRYVIQRPYVKEGKKYLEEVSQIKGFEDLDPYYTDETGKKVQKDFLTMFANILETAMKVDDPSAMTVFSEIFPIRTISGVESISVLIQDLKYDLENSINILKDMGELDEDITVDTVNIRDVIEKYMKNILEVTDEDIGMYIAGLQTTTRYDVMGLQTQWQSTVYSIFKDLQGDASSALTYFTYILRKFEENSDHMAEVIRMFVTLGVGYLGKRGIYDKMMRAGEEALMQPTDTQELMAIKYEELQSLEKAYDIRIRALKNELSSVTERKAVLGRHLNDLYEVKGATDEDIEILEGKKDLTYDETTRLNNLRMYSAIYGSQIGALKSSIDVLEDAGIGFSDSLDEAKGHYRDSLVLGEFLKGSMGARTVPKLKESFANYLRNEELYGEIAPFVLRSRVGIGDDFYEQLFSRKSELEDIIVGQQRDILGRVESIYGGATADELSKILGEHTGDDFYAIANRLSEKSKRSILNIAESFSDRFGEDFDVMQESFESNYEELNRINEELIKRANPERVAIERAIFEANRPKFLGYEKIGDSKIPMTQPITEAEKLEKYRGLLPSFGVDIDEFESGIDSLSKMFVDGKFDVDQYEVAIQEVATQLGVAEGDFERFKAVIKDLNIQIKEGKRSIYEYITALSSVTSPVSGGITHGTPIDASVENTLGSSLIGTGLGMGLARMGAPKLGAGVSMLGSKIGSTEIGAGILGLITKIGVSKIGAGIGVLLKGLATKIPPLLAIYATSRMFMSAMGGLGEAGMDDTERMTLEANKLEGVIKKATKWRIDEKDNFLTAMTKSTMGLGSVLVGSTFNAINRFFGGAAPSFLDTWKIHYKGGGASELTKEELENQLRDKYDVDLLKLKARYEKQKKYEELTPFVDPLTGELRKKGDPFLDSMPLEDLMEFLNKRTTELKRDILVSDAAFTKEKVEILIRGLTTDSREMRNAITENIDRNIKKIDELIEELKGHLPELVYNKTAYKNMEAQIAELEAEKAEAELRKFETEFNSVYNEIMERFSRESSKTQSKYDIKRYEAIIKGIKEDSNAIKQIEKKMADEQIKIISGIQTKLEALRQQYIDKPDQQERIWIQIQQLEADKKKILAEIKDKMTEGLSTFNLPSDIKPLTYYEAMTRGNTHKNITVGVGDAIVNINIDNMSGSNEDVDRLGRIVSSAVSQAQRNFVRQFANDVKSGMGNNYYSWNTY